MRKSQKRRAYRLIELLFSLTLIALLCGIIPVCYGATEPPTGATGDGTKPSAQLRFSAGSAQTLGVTTTIIVGVILEATKHPIRTAALFVARRVAFRDRRPHQLRQFTNEKFNSNNDTLEFVGRRISWTHEEYHYDVHLDKKGRLTVGDCDSVPSMQIIIDSIEVTAQSGKPVTIQFKWHLTSKAIDIQVTKFVQRL